MFRKNFRIRFRNQVKPFVILMDGGRIGSSYLVTALNKHPEVRTLGEALVGQIRYGPTAQLKWTQEYLTPPLIGRYSAIGLKTKLSDILDPVGFTEFANQKQIRLILLRRRNLVKLVVSWINYERLMSARNEGHLYKGKRRLPPATLEIEDFDQRLKHVEQQRQNFDIYIKTLRTPIFELTYENLFLDQPQAIESIFSFLGVSVMPVHGETKKVTRDDLREEILNFNELQANYLGTKYESMLEEVLFP